jgi:hypothetical protein
MCFTEVRRSKDIIAKRARIALRLRALSPMQALRAAMSMFPSSRCSGPKRPGAPAIVMTLDISSSAKPETFAWFRRADTRECGSCHGPNDYLSRKPNFSNIELGGFSSTVVANLTWTAADAGIDATIVSNHRGHVEDGVGDTIGV